MGCNMLLQFVIYYFTLKCTKMWDLSRCHCRGVCYHNTCYLCPRRLGVGGEAEGHQLSLRINM